MSNMKNFIAASTLLPLATAISIARYEDAGCSGYFTEKYGTPNVCANIGLGDCCDESGVFDSAVSGSFDDTVSVAAKFVAHSQQMGSGEPSQTFIQQVAMNTDSSQYVSNIVDDTVAGSVSGGKVVASGGAEGRRGVRRIPNAHSIAIGNVIYIVEGRDTPKAREYTALKTREERQAYVEKNADRMAKIDFMYPTNLPKPLRTLSTSIKTSIMI